MIHLAGLSRPMSVHDKDIVKSIDLNIIGTANVTKACSNNNVKLIYFSTNYVYPGTEGDYSESDALLPVNNYAWSKLGGEARYIYDFAKKDKKNLKKIFLRKQDKIGMPFNSSINLRKLKKIIKKNKI